MNTTYQPEPKYTRDGECQTNFIKDAQLGWKNMLNVLNRHLSNIASQNNYLEYL